MALKIRDDEDTDNSGQLDERADAAEHTRAAEEPDEQPDDDQLDVEVRREGDQHVVHQRSKGTRGERRAAERDAKRAKEIREIISESTRGQGEQIAALREELARLTGHLTAMSAGAGGAQRTVDQPVDVQAQYRALAKQQKEIVKLMENETSEGARTELENRWHDLEFKRSQLAAMDALRANIPRERQQEEREPPEWAELRRDYPEVVKSPDALALARTYFIQAKIKTDRENAQRRALGQRPKRFDEMAAHRDAMTRAGEDFGLYEREPSPPTVAQRGRFVGESSAAPRGKGAANRPLSDVEKIAAEVWGADLGLPKEKLYERYIHDVLLPGDPDYFER